MLSKFLLLFLYHQLKPSHIQIQDRLSLNTIRAVKPIFELTNITRTIPAALFLESSLIRRELIFEVVYESDIIVQNLPYN